MRARKKAEEAGGRVNRDTDSRDIVSARDLKETGRIAPGSQVQPAGPSKACSMDPYDKSGGCDPETYWKNLSHKKEGSDLVIEAGKEPEREYLTQPPKGYLKATKNVKATFEGNKSHEEEDPRDYFRQKPKQPD